MPDLPTPVTQRRRRPRLPEQELRDAMYKAAQQLVYEMGVTVSLEDLGFEDVIRMAGVPRSSAYRLWPYKGDFVADLLAYLAGPNWLGTAAFDEETLKLSQKIVNDNAHLLDRPEGRRAVVQEAVRQAVAQNFKAIVTSSEWHIYVALVATARSTRDDAARAQITAALATSEVTFVRLMTVFYQRMLEQLGLRLRHPTVVGFQQLAVAGAAIVEGLALRKIMVDSARALPHKNLTEEQRGDITELQSYLDVAVPGPRLGGGTTDWSLPAVAFLGVLDAISEPDPEFTLAATPDH